MLIRFTLKARVDRTLAWMVEDGATASGALIALIAGLESDGPAIMVVDMIEQGLNQPTQDATIAYLRRRGPGGRPIFMLTRSSSILDLTAVGTDEAIILCPANHSRQHISRRIPARPATRLSPPVWPRPRCGPGRKASSRGAPSRMIFLLSGRKRAEA